MISTVTANRTKRCSCAAIVERFYAPHTYIFIIKVLLSKILTKPSCILGLRAWAVAILQKYL